MNSQPAQKPSLSLIFRLGGERGMILSLPMIMASAAFFFSLDLPQLSLLVGPAILLEAILWPLIVGKTISRYPFLCSFTPLWTVGVLAFIGGALICSLFSAVMVIWVKPGFIQDYVAYCIESLSKGEMTPISGLDPASLTNAVKYKLIPSGLEFVESMFWSASFFGSMYSMLVAAIMPGIIRMRNKNKNRINQ